MLSHFESCWFRGFQSCDLGGSLLNGLGSLGHASLFLKGWASGRGQICSKEGLLTPSRIFCYVLSKSSSIPGKLTVFDDFWHCLTRCFQSGLMSSHCMSEFLRCWQQGADLESTPPEKAACSRQMSSDIVRYSWDGQSRYYQDLSGVGDGRCLKKLQ